MPLVPDKNQQVAFTRLIGAPEQETNEDFSTLLGAALRTENTLGSLIARENGLPDSVVNDESFNPWDHITEDEKQDSQFIDNVMLADNELEIESVRKQSFRERKDRRLLADNGAQSFFAQLAAGALDPINLIPVGGTAYKTYRAGASILKSAAVTAGVASSSQAAVEMGLHHTQIERTFGESAVNVTGAMLLGGILGGSSSAIRNALKADPDVNINIEDSMNPEVKVSSGDNSIFTSGENKSAGAAAVDRDIQVQGKIARALTKALGFDPLSRSITSDLVETRNLAVQLAENPIAMENKTGTFVADAVETAAKIKDGRYYEAIEGHLNIFKEYRKTGGVLKRKQFNEAVAKEMRNPKSNDPSIKKSADTWRSKLYEPLKREMIDAELLPKDIEVKTAENYLNRLWNKEKVRANLDDFVNVVSSWLRDQQGKQEAVENFFPLAREIATRITSTPDGRLPYDYKIAENSSKGSGKQGLSGAFRERSFNISDDLVEQFLENDIEQLGGRYLKNIAVDIELVKRFGDVNMTKEIKEISEAWDLKIQEASKTSKKKAIKLSKQKKRDIESIAAMRDRMRGVYGQVDSDDFWVRAGRVSRDLNYLRFMGGVTASSIPDVARIVMSKGIVKTFKNGLIPLIKNNKAFASSADEAKRYGVGTDILLGGRSEIIADVADYSQGGTVFERGVRAAAAKFGQVNLIDRWTASVKQLHAVVAQTDMANMLVRGDFDSRLQQLGINEDVGRDIAKQLRKYGKKTDNVWIAKTRLWDDQALAEIWGGALRKESDRVIVMPGQEKPLFMSREMGKTFLQFRSFMFAATQRMLIAGIQGQDAHYIQGIIGLTSLGMMAYVFKQWDAGREISDDPAVWVTEGIDRSGVTGIIMEMNNTIEKISNNNFGLRPLLGISTPSSRFASRSQSEAFLGPTFGSMLSTVLKVSGGTADGELDNSDVRTIRRLLPYQNLMIFRQLIDKAEKGIQ